MRWIFSFFFYFFFPLVFFFPLSLFLVFFFPLSFSLVFFFPLFLYSGAQLTIRFSPHLWKREMHLKVLMKLSGSLNLMESSFNVMSSIVLEDVNLYVYSFFLSFFFSLFFFSFIFLIPLFSHLLLFLFPIFSPSKVNSFSHPNSIVD